MLDASIKKNDRLARVLILTVSLVVFLAVVILSRVKLDVDLGFDVHVFATINAVINSIVSVLLIAALAAVKNKQICPSQEDHDDCHIPFSAVPGFLYSPSPVIRRYTLRRHGKYPYSVFFHPHHAYIPCGHYPSFYSFYGLSRTGG